jgi:phage-related protein
MPQALPMTDRISQNSAAMQREYRSNSAEFGDGYSQDAPLGIAPIRDTWPLTYEHLTNDERNTLVSVLDAVGSWDYLTWTADGDTVQKRWKVTKDGWSATYTGIYWNVSFTLKETR